VHAFNPARILFCISNYGHPPGLPIQGESIGSGCDIIPLRFGGKSLPVLQRGERKIRVAPFSLKVNQRIKEGFLYCSLQWAFTISDHANRVTSEVLNYDWCSARAQGEFI
jgi:hypothetical protein